MAEERRWVLADASTAGTVRFGSAVPGTSRVDSVVMLAAERHSTFTDALLTYERESGVQMRGAECVLAVAAPPAGDAIPVARSRWTISRSGLNQMFGRPVAVINDVAATAWSLLGGGNAKLEYISGPAFDFTRPGRWVVVLLDDGVNAAALDIAEDGRCHVIDGEAGNAGFSPSNDAEIDLMRTLRQRSHHVSWESALNAGWGEQQASEAERHAWAGMAGTFAGDTILQLGAWTGIILTGRHCKTLHDPRRMAQFVKRFEEKSRYSRFLAAGSRAFLATRDPLAGGLSLLAARHKARIN
ncbi:MAG TPA: glucokinase [Sphingomonas sp.]|nr:glucokinase [Sphingomonas sp.]